MSKIRTIARRIILAFKMLKDEMYWYFRCTKYNNVNHTQEADLSSLLVTSHVLEKGITMPNRRLGFGYDRVREVLKFCNHCINLYGNEHNEIQSSITDLHDYLAIHKDASYVLPKDITKGIEELQKYRLSKDGISSYFFSKESFFSPYTSFSSFAQSRHTCRHYSDKPVEIERIVRCIQLAQSAPSACNRQSTRVHIISSEPGKKTVLKYQNGSRGFGQYADKFILITAEQNAWEVRQAKSAYIDAGIFTMALLYALHEERICACTLNAHIYHNQINEFYKEIGIPKSEIPIVFISIGNAPDNFVVAKSERLNINKIFDVL